MPKTEQDWRDNSNAQAIVQVAAMTAAERMRAKKVLKQQREDADAADKLVNSMTKL